MIDRKLILDFATKKHEGQVRKNSGAPYITHPIAVAEIAESANPAYADRIYAVAICHDLLEDTDTNAAELIDLFVSAGFSEERSIRLVGDVIFLTRKKEKDIIEYLERIRSSLVATFVKRADLKHNMSDLKPGNLLDKYKLCLFYLQQ